MPLNSHTSVTRKKRRINHENIQFHLDFEVPSFKTLLVDELNYYQEWILFSFNFMNINVTKRKTNTITKLDIRDIALVDLTMTFNSGLLSKKKLLLGNAK